MLSAKSNIFSIKPDDEFEIYKKAYKRVKEMKRFYTNLISYFIIIAFLIFINFTTKRHSHWFWYPALGWGVVLAFRAFRIFGIGDSWQEKKIREVMNQQKNKDHEDI